MVTIVKEEFVVAGIRQQIVNLESLRTEIEAERLSPEALGWRIKAVELQLKKLREAA